MSEGLKKTPPRPRTQGTPMEWAKFRASSNKDGTYFIHEVAFRWSSVDSVVFEPPVWAEMGPGPARSADEPEFKPTSVVVFLTSGAKYTFVGDELGRFIAEYQLAH